MRLIDLLKPGDFSWFLHILEIYNLEVFCISQEYDCLYFYKAATGVRSSDILKLSPSQAILDQPLKLDGARDPGIQIIICCRVTKMVLGLLYSRKRTLSYGYVSKLASFKAVLSELGLSGTMGTKIGSLLLTSYSLFLLSQTTLKSFRLQASFDAIEFYTDVIKMVDSDGCGELRTDKLPCPGAEYYSTMPVTPVIYLATLIQRRFRSQKIATVCTRINTLILRLEKVKSQYTTTLEYHVIGNIINCLQKTSSVDLYGIEESLEGIGCEELFHATKQYLYSSFLHEYKDIPVVQKIFKKFGVK